MYIELAFRGKYFHDSKRLRVASFNCISTAMCTFPFAHSNFSNLKHENIARLFIIVRHRSFIKIIGNGKHLFPSENILFDFLIAFAFMQNFKTEFAVAGVEKY